MAKQDCDDCRKCQERAFELEVDEDLQQERLNKFWKKYSWLVYTAVVLILATTAGVQFYQSWRTKLRLAESDIFEKVEQELYEEYPELKNKEITFLLNGGAINTSGTLKQNKIKNSAIILINYSD